MASASPSISYSHNSILLNATRPQLHDATFPLKARVAGGFLVEDDSDSESDVPIRSWDRDLPQNGAEDSQESQIVPLVDEGDDIDLTRLEDDTITPSQHQPNPYASLDDHDRYSGLFGTAHTTLFSHINKPKREIVTCSGRSIPLRERKATTTVSYEGIAAARSKTKEGRAKRSYYGVDIHDLVSVATKELAERGNPTHPPADPDTALRSVEQQGVQSKKKQKRFMLWTEKYRARNFMDLVGDDLTNRQVLRWLKRWDPIVFPHSTKIRPAVVRRPGVQAQAEEEKPHRKILLLTGPPGLGKTTLAHVCARQAGYEVMEINASDERSRDVVKGRIRMSLGTESVKMVEHGKQPDSGKPQKIARPICVVVDEVDGVVSGSGGSGEGGFIKALIDLVLTDQKNSSAAEASHSARRKKKGDDFRQMRPLVLICNDVYHPSLRPLRQSGLAEIIHVGKPPVEAVVARIKTVFEKEGIPCEKDAARKLCEAAWGMSSGIDAKRGAHSSTEGDLRGVMVVAEWVAGRLKAASKDSAPKLTRQWLEEHILNDLAHGGGAARGLGRGGTKEVVSRVFQEGAGFPKQVFPTAQSKKTLHEQPQAQLSFSEQVKKYAMVRLAEMVETSGEIDRIMTEIFSEYPEHDFNDDSYLSKPDAAYEWMHFHDTCSSRLYSNQDWELTPYLSQPVLACHHLFASPKRHYAGVATRGYDRKWGNAEDETAPPPVPFSGPRASFEAHEAEKANRAVLQSMQSQLPPSLSRSFRSPEHLATDFVPYLVRLVSPDVKPVVVGGSATGDRSGSVASVRREAEKVMVRRAAQVLAEVGITLQKGRIEADVAAGPMARTQWVYRLDPDIDALATYETAGALVLSAQAPTRYAVRQVLELELQKTIAERENSARKARFRAGGDDPFEHDDKENSQPGLHDIKSAASGRDVGHDRFGSGVKRDFFGRVVTDKDTARPLGEAEGNAGNKRPRLDGEHGHPDRKVWVTYREGLNNAVRKPLSLEEFLRGL